VSVLVPLACSVEEGWACSVEEGWAHVVAGMEEPAELVGE
jgi:hypothetical protein